MTIKGYAESTQRSYIYHLQEFALYFKSCPSKLEEGHVIEYLRHLSEDKGLSKSAINSAYSGIKLLFVHTLDKPWNTVHLPRPKRNQVLPIILSVSQVKAIFSATTNLKHQTILMLIYSSGLRLEEVCGVQVRDIISSRKLLFVRQGKGGKDRYRILPDSMLGQLAIYRKIYRPYKWLFSGQNPSQPYSKSSVQSIYKASKEKAGIIQSGGVHQLRHCFATHLVEAGMDIATLQKLLGHSSLKATSVYLHLSGVGLSDFEHPLDKKC